MERENIRSTAILIPPVAFQRATWRVRNEAYGGNGENRRDENEKICPSFPSANIDPLFAVGICDSTVSFRRRTYPTSTRENLHQFAPRRRTKGRLLFNEVAGMGQRGPWKFEGSSELGDRQVRPFCGPSASRNSRDFPKRQGSGLDVVSGCRSFQIFLSYTLKWNRVQWD